MPRTNQTRFRARSTWWHAALATAVLLACAAPARAAFPDRPIHLIVPTAAGGTADIIARIIAPRLAEAWGQPVIVEDRGGGLGVIGTDAVAKAARDGYTIGLFPSSQAVDPLVIKDLPFDPFTSFSAVGMVATAPGLLVVNAQEVAATDLKGVIDSVRANPGKFNYASAVPLTAGHRSMELLKHMAGLDIQHIPYNGGGPAVADLLAGHVQFMIGAVPSLAPQVASGRLRALAVTSPQRFDTMPAIPTLAESGYPGFDSVEWYGIFTQAGVSPPIVQRLSTDIQHVMERDDVRRQLLALGAVAAPGTPEQLQATLLAEYKRWHDLVGQVDLHAD